jgi:uncharacterized membrane protein YbhN (UPF0104 family)
MVEPARRGTPFISTWQYRAAVISAVLAAFGYLAVGVWSGWHEVVRAIHAVGFAGIGIALVLSLVNYGLRYCRWQAYLGALGHRVPAWTSLRIYLAGFALSTTPGKVGELLRGALLSQWNVPFRKTLAAFFSERLSDLSAIVLIAFLGFAFLPSGRVWIVMGAVVIVIALVLLSSPRLPAWLQHRLGGAGRVSRALREVSATLIEAGRCNTPVLLAMATVASLVAWSSEGLAFYLVLQWMGESVPLALAMSIYATAMLAGAISFLPGGLGGAEAVMVALLVWRGMDAGSAVAATLIIRLATLWFAVMIGGAVVATYLQKTQPSPQSST